ncbi:hypothetical protein ACIPTZ_07790 [Pectobacterium sp. CHL-2024]|uniref:hypothetical protein n=1 Tax=Pectobacterium sp. CHL-2024 TaxID=3377079 RepID=UPI003824FADE
MKTKKENILKPINSVYLIENDSILLLGIEELTAKRIGLKAFGLCSIPECWTLPFFVVSNYNNEYLSLVDDLINSMSFKKNHKLIVRSSGVFETIHDRGSLESEVCEAKDVKITLASLKEKYKNDSNSDPIHWIIQPYIEPVIKGHLSNERRVSKVLRDWVVEDETNGASERQPISLRNWRDSRPTDIEILHCNYKINYVESLKPVASWGHSKALRLHFEWVWSGSQMFIVQADQCDVEDSGVNPRKLVKNYQSDIKISEIRLFRPVKDIDFKIYRKLENARIYRELGYSETPFYILADDTEFRRLLSTGCVSNELYSDLCILTSRPLVLRTDGKNIPSKNRQMLPRSDELRSPEDAKNWLLNTFRKSIIDAGIQDCDLCLIAHHFIPAAASAWCLAYPDKRKVRIESLWGLPEGLYWYPHDVYDVDTKTQSINFTKAVVDSFKCSERLRYKEKFIAPNDSGQWVLHKTSNSYDWKGSVSNKSWVNEIAATSRLIANKANEAVVVMWFVDTDLTASSKGIIPWYHERWEGSNNAPKAAPKKNNHKDITFKIQTRSHCQQLKTILSDNKTVNKILIDPTEPELVRDQKFALDIANLSKDHSINVVLAGGILSHAYYILSKQGCQVECVDLYATQEEEIEYNKLVRNNIPDIINSHGEDVRLIKLKGDALISALKRKVIEEAFEINDAKTIDDIVEEMSDLQEVIIALQNELRISKSIVEQKRKDKAKKRGTFSSGVMLSQTALQSPLVAYDMAQEDEMLKNHKFEKTISLEELLPSHPNDLHIDKRFDNEGRSERQLTFSLPTHEVSHSFSNTVFTLISENNKEEKYVFNLSLERKEGLFKFKIRIKNAPSQLKLDL